ncbi:MAG TPA: ATP-binding protein [bacterium]
MRTSIAFRLNLIVLLVVLALGSVLGALSVLEQRAILRGELDRRMQFMGEYLARAVAEAAARQDTETMNAILRGATLDREVTYLMVKSREGEIQAAHWQSDVRGAVKEYTFPVAPPPAAGAGAEPAFGPVSTPVTSGAIAQLALGISLEPMGKVLARHIWRTAALLAAAVALALVLGSVFVRVLHRQSFLPLLAGIKAIGDGDLSRRIVPDRHAEIGEIGRAFNEMAARLSSTLITKAGLEFAVHQRTADLEAALQERILIQTELAEREERIRLLLDSTAEAIYGIDPEGTCTFCNPACCRILGHGKPEDLTGRKIHDLIHHSREDGSPHPSEECRLRDVVRTGAAYHAADEVLWRSDGSPVHVECWSHPVLHDGQISGAVVTFVEITERRKLEEQLVQAQKLEGIGILAGGIAHDFNNLLSPILGFADLTLLRLEPGHPARRSLESVVESAKRAADLTRQILAFSRRQVLQKKVLNLNDEILAVGRMVKRIIGEDIDVRLNLTAELPPIEADPTQIQQVLLNLAVNARDAMPAGGRLTVETGVARIDGSSPWLARGLDGERCIVLTVSDTGCGMDERTRQRVFEPFFTTKAAGRGTGLGLSTVHGIVKQHGGDIAVYSEPGHGTTFRVYLPVAEAAVPAGSETPAAAGPPRGNGAVLLVEDDEGVRTFMAAALAEYGYGVTAVASPAEALAAAPGATIDLVISDVVMPGMSGPELCRRLAELRPGIRVLYISGYPSGAGALDRLLDKGTPLLQKPFTVGALLQAVRDTIGTPAAG